MIISSYSPGSPVNDGERPGRNFYEVTKMLILKCLIAAALPVIGAFIIIGLYWLYDKFKGE